MKSKIKVFFPKGNFQIDSGAGICTQVKKKRAFKSVNSAFRWFKVRKWEIEGQIHFAPGKYTEDIKLIEGIELTGGLDE